MSTFKTRLDNLRHTEFLAVTQQEFGLSALAGLGSGWTGQLPAAPFVSVPPTSAKGPTVWRVPARLVAAPAPAIPAPAASAPFFPNEPEWNRPVSAPIQPGLPQATPFAEPEPMLPRLMEASQAAPASPLSAPVASVPAPSAPLSVPTVPAPAVSAPPISAVPFSSPTQNEISSSDPLWAAPLSRAEPGIGPLDVSPATPSRLPGADAALSPQELLTRAETVSAAPLPAVAEAQASPASSGPDLVSPADAPARTSPRRATFREVMALNDLGSAEPEAAPVVQEPEAPAPAASVVPTPQTDASTSPVAPAAQALQDAAPLLAAALAPVVVDAALPEVQTPQSSPAPSIPAPQVQSLEAAVTPVPARLDASVAPPANTAQVPTAAQGQPVTPLTQTDSAPVQRETGADTLAPVADEQSTEAALPPEVPAAAVVAEVEGAEAGAQTGVLPTTVLPTAGVPTPVLPTTAAPLPVAAPSEEPVSQQVARPSAAESAAPAEQRGTESEPTVAAPEVTPTAQGFALEASPPEEPAPTSTETAQEAAVTEPAERRMGADELKAIEAIMRGGDQEIGVILPRRPRPTRRPTSEAEGANGPSQSPRTPPTPTFEELPHAEVMSVFERLNRMADADAEGSTETRMLSFEELTTGQLRRTPTAPIPVNVNPAAPASAPLPSAPAPSAPPPSAAPNSTGRFRATARPRADGQAAAAPNPAPAAPGQTPREPQARSQTADQTDEEGHSSAPNNAVAGAPLATENAPTAAPVRMRESQAVAGAPDLQPREASAVPPQFSRLGEAAMPEPQPVSYGLPAARAEHSTALTTPALPRSSAGDFALPAPQVSETQAESALEIGLPTVHTPKAGIMNMEAAAQALPITAAPPTPAPKLAPVQLPPVQGAPELPSSAALLDLATQPTPTPQALGREVVIETGPEVLTAVAEVSAVPPVALPSGPRLGEPLGPPTVAPVPAIRPTGLLSPLALAPAPLEPASELPLARVAAVLRPSAPEGLGTVQNSDPVSGVVPQPAPVSAAAHAESPLRVSDVQDGVPRQPQDDAPQKLAQAVQGLPAVPVTLAPLEAEPALPAVWSPNLPTAETDSVASPAPMQAAIPPTPTVPVEPLELPTLPSVAVAAGPNAVAFVPAAPIFPTVNTLPLTSFPTSFPQVRAIGATLLGPPAAPPVTRNFSDANVPIYAAPRPAPVRQTDGIVPSIAVPVRSAPAAIGPSLPALQRQAVGPLSVLEQLAEAQAVQTRAIEEAPPLEPMRLGTPAPELPAGRDTPEQWVQRVEAQASAPALPSSVGQANVPSLAAPLALPTPFASGPLTLALPSGTSPNLFALPNLAPVLNFPAPFNTAPLNLAAPNLAAFNPTLPSFPGLLPVGPAPIGAPYVGPAPISPVTVPNVSPVFPAPLNTAPFNPAPLNLVAPNLDLATFNPTPPSFPGPLPVGPAPVNAPYVAPTLPPLGQWLPQPVLPQPMLQQMIGENFSWPQPAPVNVARAAVGPTQTPVLTAPLPASPLPPSVAPAAPGFSVLAPSVLTPSILAPSVLAPSILSPSVQAQMTNALGVRVNDIPVVQHAGTQALLAQHRAEALTVGDTVILGPNIDLRSPVGLGILAHELTHALRARTPDFVPRLVQGAPTPRGEEGLALQVEGAVRASARAQGQPSLQNYVPETVSSFASPSAPAPRSLPRSAAPPRSAPVESTPLAAPRPDTAALARLPAPWEPMPFWEDDSSRNTPATASAVSAPAARLAPPPIASAAFASAPVISTPFSGAPTPIYAASTDRQVTEPAPALPTPSPAPSAAPASPPSSSPSTPATATARQPSKAQQTNLDELAQQVYNVLKRRLANESRRRT